MDIMFDLETLDTSPEAVILSMGAVKFDPRKLPEIADTLYLRFDIDDQTALGRVISEETLTWWGTQPAAIQESTFSEEGRLPLEEALTQFHKFVWNADRVWSQGSFDTNIMEHLYKQMKRPLPWKYWQVRDSRTMFDFVDPQLDRSAHHDALEDAKAQANGVQRVLQKMGWVGLKL